MDTVFYLSFMMEFELDLFILWDVTFRVIVDVCDVKRLFLHLWVGQLNLLKIFFELLSIVFNEKFFALLEEIYWDLRCLYNLFIFLFEKKLVCEYIVFIVGCIFNSISSLKYGWVQLFWWRLGLHNGCLCNRILVGSKISGRGA